MNIFSKVAATITDSLWGAVNTIQDMRGAARDRKYLAWCQQVQESKIALATFWDQNPYDPSGDLVIYVKPYKRPNTGPKVLESAQKNRLQYLGTWESKGNGTYYLFK